MASPCSICLDTEFYTYIDNNNNPINDLNRPFITSCCSNKYHYGCLVRWAHSNNTCPTCRKSDIITSIIDSVHQNNYKFNINFMNLYNNFNQDNNSIPLSSDDDNNNSTALSSDLSSDDNPTGSSSSDNLDNNSTTLSIITNTRLNFHNILINMRDNIRLINLNNLNNPTTLYNDQNYINTVENLVDSTIDELTELADRYFPDINTFT